jgi:hypothetical protein
LAFFVSKIILRSQNKQPRKGIRLQFLTIEVDWHPRHSRGGVKTPSGCPISIPIHTVGRYELQEHQQPVFP